MLPLTLRPTRLGTPAAFADLADWNVLEGRREGKRWHMCTVPQVFILPALASPAPSSPEQVWFWSITELIPNPTGTRTSGHAATFEEAKAQFQDHWLLSIEESAAPCFLAVDGPRCD